MSAEQSIRSPLIWTGVGVLVMIACGVNAFLEDTTLMMVLSWIGVAVGAVSAAFSIGELVAIRRARRAAAEESLTEATPSSD